MSKATQSAQALVSKCAELGWSWEVRGGILTISKYIKPNNNDSFVKADMEYYGILSHLKRTSAGSDWGTDGGGIGGLNAMKTGRFVMNRSGGSKMVLKALAKMQ
jgi:hypothetical protein